MLSAPVIYTVTLDVELGQVDRPVSNGVNVSRILKRLGRETLALGFIRAEESQVRAQLDNDGVPHAFDDVIAPSPAPVTGVTFAGDPLDDIKARLSAASAGAVVVLSGRVPPHRCEAVYAELCCWLTARKLRPVIDASGPALVHALECSPLLVKPSLEEAEDILGSRLRDDASVLAAAQTLRKRAAGYVVISQGGNGAIGAGPEGAWKTTPPRVHRRANGVKGDTMVAALAIALNEGFGFADGLRFATAAGTAAVSVGTRLCNAKDVELLSRRVVVKEMTSEHPLLRPQLLANQG